MNCVQESNFKKALKHILKWEGGYVNDPVDPGGKTKYGISDRRDGRIDGKADLDGDGRGDKRIEDLTLDDAGKVYKSDYWDKVKGDDLIYPIALMSFDCAVNQGVYKATRWMQRALGVKQDGIIGPITLGAANKINPKTFVLRYYDYRLRHYKSLRTWRRFGRGWTNRINDIKKEALKYS